jgi:hypothetical protein
MTQVLKAPESGPCGRGRDNQSLTGDGQYFGMAKQPLKSNHLYMRTTEGWNCLIRYESVEEAVKVYRCYEDENTRQRECIQSCWIIDANTRQMILGRPPSGWSPDIPAHENAREGS